MCSHQLTLYVVNCHNIQQRMVHSRNKSIYEYMTVNGRMNNIIFTTHPLFLFEKTSHFFAIQRWWTIFKLSSSCYLVRNIMMNPLTFYSCNIRDMVPFAGYNSLMIRFSWGMLYWAKS